MNVFHYLFGNVHSAMNEFSELAYDSHGTRIRAIPQVRKKFVGTKSRQNSYAHDI